MTEDFTSDEAETEKPLSVGIDLKELGDQMSKRLKCCPGIEIYNGFSLKNERCRHERFSPPPIPQAIPTLRPLWSRDLNSQTVFFDIHTVGYLFVAVLVICRFIALDELTPRRHCLPFP